MTSLRILAVAASLAALPAAADLNAELARCTAEKNSVQRLDCFDKTASRNGIKSASATTTAGVGKWRVHREVSKIDDSQTVVLSLSADNAVTGWPSKRYVPVLHLRCQQKRTEAYIDVGMASTVEYGHDGATVTLRFDKEKATKQRMAQSTDREALFFSQAVPMIKQMSSHSTMLFEFVPFNASPAMTTFDLTGLPEAIKPLREACKW